MNKEYLYCANWKMNFSFNEEVEFATTNCDALIKLAEKKNVSLVLCPSFVSLFPLCKMFTETPTAIGAQDCSNHQKGNFTGQVSAQSLHQLGCQYCIIGHSERRTYRHETNEEIAEKFIHLIDFDISPIICVGETKKEYEAHATFDVLTAQLQSIFKTIATPLHISKSITVCIAYEPIWSIGTGKLATNDHLETVFAWLSQQTKKLKNGINWKLIYGGSVNGETSKNLKKIPQIEGFLVGGASLHFQEFKKIVD